MYPKTFHLRMFRLVAAALFVALAASAGHSLERQPATNYHARRVALAQKLEGGVAVLFAAEQPLVDFMPYRQDEDFYYLTGWNEPGAALMLIAGAPDASPARSYREILFLPMRNLRMEKYTGIKLDAATPGAAQKAGVDEVLPMTELPAQLDKLITADRSLVSRIWAQPTAPQAKSLVGWTATTLGNDTTSDARDVINCLRVMAGWVFQRSLPVKRSWMK